MTQGTQVYGGTENMKSCSLKVCCTAVWRPLCAAPLIAVAQDMPAGAWAGTWVANSAKSEFSRAPAHLGPGHHSARWVGGRPRCECRWKDERLVIQTASRESRTRGRDNTTVEVVKVNAYRQNHIWDHEGKITHTHSTLSKDGKVQTFYGAPGTYRAPGETKAKTFSEVVVYEKQ